jgi:hypothetical protein
VLWHGDGRGDPHGDTPDPALLAITVEEVAEACNRALKAEQGESPHAKLGIPIT